MTNTTTTQTVVWYWIGGEARGRWMPADPSCPKSLGGHGGDVAACVASIRRGGRVAVVSTTGYPPTGAPTSAQFAEVLGPFAWPVDAEDGDLPGGGNVYDRKAR